MMLNICNDLLGKSYYEAMFIINEYNQLYPENKISLVVSKINQNKKFVKYVSISSIFYIHLITTDPEITSRLKHILEYPYESDQRHQTAKYFQELLLNPENTKALKITHIFRV